MSNEVVPESPLSLPDMISEGLDLPAEFEAQLEASSFIPNIQLLQPLSEVVQNPPRDVNVPPVPGEYWLGQNMGMGKLFDAVPFAAKMHALLIVDRKVDCESFDHKAADFIRIQQMDEKKRTLPNGTVPRWGVDVLLYLPKFKRWAIFFLYSTARSQAKQFTNNGGKLLSVRSRMASNANKNKWSTPDIYPGETCPPALLAEMGDPTPIIAKFKNRTPRSKQATEAQKAAAQASIGQDR